MNKLETAIKEVELLIEPRWPVVVALLAAGGIYLAMPPAMAFGGRWTLLVVVGVLLVPALITHRLGQYRWSTMIGLLINAVVSFFELASLVLLVRQLPDPAIKPVALLTSAAALWISNILVFSLWYWRLDEGAHGHAKSMAGIRPVGFYFRRCS